MAIEEPVNLSSDLTELEWVNLLADLESERPSQENQIEKMKRKFKEQPLVPIGCLATISCLVFGLAAFRKGNSKTQQFFMRGRVAAQGFTVVVIVGGLFSAVSSTPPSK